MLALADHGEKLLYEGSGTRELCDAVLLLKLKPSCNTSSLLRDARLVPAYFLPSSPSFLCLFVFFISHHVGEGGGTVRAPPAVNYGHIDSL